jgi:hypothetical protein
MLEEKGASSEKRRPEEGGYDALLTTLRIFLF